MGNIIRSFHVKGNEDQYETINLEAWAIANKSSISTVPRITRFFIENLLQEHLRAGYSIESKNSRSYKQALELLNSSANEQKQEISFTWRPARVVLQDFTGVPVITDLVALRLAAPDEIKAQINPVTPTTLIIDHSVQIHKWSSSDSMQENMEIEIKNNNERYSFLKWAQQNFKNFYLVPPGKGIIHQINLEYLTEGVRIVRGRLLQVDSCIGTDSHTTMINGLGIPGWGVGGLEAESVMLGTPIEYTSPRTVGVELLGKIPPMVYGSDLALHIVQKLRELNVVGCYVEFFGSGVQYLSLPDRCTIANMAPEYGASSGLFPLDKSSIEFYKNTGRNGQLIEAWARNSSFWLDSDSEHKIKYQRSIKIELGALSRSMAGPKRPQDRFNLREIPLELQKILPPESGATTIEHGSVVLAAITSCTNTSNPAVILAAGLVAQKANQLGIKPKKWVKCSMALGSKTASLYLQRAGLFEELEQLGFSLDAYGCASCIGNSGPLDPELAKAISTEEINVCSVISGNRNFEGRIHPLIKHNFLASPPLVVIASLAGSLLVNFEAEPIATAADGSAILLKDLLPSDKLLNETLQKALDPNDYKLSYADIFSGTSAWERIAVPAKESYEFSPDSSYIQLPPFATQDSKHLHPLLHGKTLKDCRVLFAGGDSITTDHISPAGIIAKNSPAAKYLSSMGLSPSNFNSYGSRRGNFKLMQRGTFANTRLKNKILNLEGGLTYHSPTKELMSIYDAAEKYKAAHIPLVIFAGTEYGTGSSRDWAAKGVRLLGVSAIIAKSFERIHRANLVAMAVLPLIFTEPEYPFALEDLLNAKVSLVPSTKSLRLDTKFYAEVEIIAEKYTLALELAVNTGEELEWIQAGGLLPKFLDKLSAKK